MNPGAVTELDLELSVVAAPRVRAHHGLLLAAVAVELIASGIRDMLRPP